MGTHSLGNLSRKRDAELIAAGFDARRRFRLLRIRTHRFGFIPTHYHVPNSFNPFE